MHYSRSWQHNLENIGFLIRELVYIPCPSLSFWIGSGSPLLSFPPSLPLELSDGVCLRLPPQEARTKCWHASLSYPTSTSLVPAVSSILPSHCLSGVPPSLPLFPPCQSYSLTCVPQQGTGSGEGAGSDNSPPCQNIYPTMPLISFPACSAPWHCRLLASD